MVGSAQSSCVFFCLALAKMEAHSSGESVLIRSAKIQTTFQTRKKMILMLAIKIQKLNGKHLRK
jgi:hypothetical protein